MIPSTRMAPMPSPPPPIGSPKPPPPPEPSSPRRSSIFWLSGTSSRRIDLSSSPAASFAERGVQVHVEVHVEVQGASPAASSGARPRSGAPVHSVFRSKYSRAAARASPRNATAQNYGYLKANTIVQIFSELKPVF